MKMTFKTFLYLTAFQFSKLSYGQLSLTNPLICHDKDNYLKCYNDGDYILTFNKGNFKEFKTSDNSLKYSDVERKITFLHESKVFGSLTIDTIQITQLAKSILLTKGTSSLEIISTKDIPKQISDYGVGTYSIDNVVRGFTFWSGNRYAELEIWTYGKTWHWNLIIKENQRSILIDYNGFKHNRFENFFISDDNLRYGMAIAMTFKSLKKLWYVESVYVDTLWTLDNGSPAIGPISLDKNYKYMYNKAGKLKLDKIKGELRLCECN